MFMNAFEDVSRIQIFSVKDLEQELNRIRDTCSNPNTEWEKRIECLRKFRSLLIAGAADYEEFYQYLKPLEVPFQTSVKDLRSQVVREACISIAYLSQRIGNKFVIIFLNIDQLIIHLLFFPFIDVIDLPKHCFHL